MPIQLKNTLRRLCVALVTIAVLFAFPQTAKADTLASTNAPAFVTLYVYRYAFDNAGNAYFETERFEAHGRLASDTQALLRIRFANLLESPAKTPCVAQGTRLLGIWQDHDTLFINVSREILSFGGGVANERLLLNQILRNAAEVPGAACLVLLVEGAEVTWPEGSRTAWIPIRADETW